MQVFIFCKITLHVSGVHRTHHQEYIKLLLQPLVQVIVSEQQPSSKMAIGHVGGCCNLPITPVLSRHNFL